MSTESSDLSEPSLVTPLRPKGWERSGSIKERLVGVEALIAVRVQFIIKLMGHQGSHPVTGSSG